MNPLDRMKARMTRSIATTRPSAGAKTQHTSLSADRIIARGTALKNASATASASHEVNANIISEYTKQYKEFIANELPIIIASEKAKIAAEKAKMESAETDKVQDADVDSVEAVSADVIPEAQGISVGSEASESVSVVLKAAKKIRKSKKTAEKPAEETSSESAS